MAENDVDVGMGEMKWNHKVTSDQSDITVKL